MKMLIANVQILVSVFKNEINWKGMLRNGVVKQVLFCYETE